MANAKIAQDACVRQLMALLCANGLKRLVISPGSRSTPLVQAAVEMPELALDSVLDERSAAFFALGLARDRDALAGVLCTSGTAVAHLLPACVEATESAWPLLVLSADRPLNVRGLGAPQAILQAGLLAPYARHFFDIDAGQGLDSVCQSLVSALQDIAERGGVVHVNVALDLPLALLPGAPLSQIGAKVANRVREITRINPPATGEHVLLMCCQLPSDKHAIVIINQIAQRGDVTVVCDTPSHLRKLPGTIQPIRHVDALLAETSLRALLRPDRIVRLGIWPTSKGAQLLSEDFANANLPVDVVSPWRPSDPLRQTRVHVIDTSIANALRDWVAAPAAATVGVDRWQLADHAATIAATNWPASWDERAIILELSRHLQPGDQLVLGNSMPLRDWDDFSLPIEDLAVQVHRGANGIDGTLAMALGAALALKRRTLLYLGDCTFLHDIGSLQLLNDANRQHLGLRVAVLNNDGGAIFDYLPAHDAVDPAAHRRFFTTPHALNLTAICQGFGVSARRIADLAALQEALAQPLAIGQVQVLELLVDAQVSRQMHAAYRRSLSDAARRVLALP